MYIKYNKYDKLKNAKFVRNVYISNNTFSEFYSLLINLTF